MTSLRPLRLLSLLVTAVSLSVALSLAPAAAAPGGSPAPPSGAAPAGVEPSARLLFGSIALAADGTTGYSYDYKKKGKAKARAVRECRNRSGYPGTCKTAVWVRNGCAAVYAKFDSRGFVTSYKWGVGRTPKQAKKKANKNYGGNYRGRVCTTRYY